MAGWLGRRVVTINQISSDQDVTAPAPRREGLNSCMVSHSDTSSPLIRNQADVASVEKQKAFASSRRISRTPRVYRSESFLLVGKGELTAREGLPLDVHSLGVSNGTGEKRDRFA